MGARAEGERMSIQICLQSGELGFVKDLASSQKELGNRVPMKVRYWRIWKPDPTELELLVEPDEVEARLKYAMEFADRQFPILTGLEVEIAGIEGAFRWEKPPTNDTVLAKLAEARRRIYDKRRRAENGKE